MNWWSPEAVENESNWCSGTTVQYKWGGSVEGIVGRANTVATLTVSATLTAPAMTTTITAAAAITNQFSNPDSIPGSYVPKTLAIGVGAGLSAALLASTGALLVLLWREKKKRVAAETCRTLQEDRGQHQQMQQDMQRAEYPTHGAYKAAPNVSEIHGDSFTAELSGHDRRGNFT
ncbi:hypothetical protein LTR95_007746 [Oleoguttula sp. CCFEE 5521]